MRNGLALIIGCGELGSRHLQALAAVPEIRAIEVYDPRSDALALGRRRLEEVSGRCVRDVRWLSDMESAAKDGDLCVVSTRSDVRCGLVREAADRLGYTSFLLEKVVAQSIRDYQNLLEFASRKSLSVWVNCKARANFSHQTVKSRLDPALPIVFTAQGGNLGLANNGIHAADLFAFYDSADRIECIGAQLDPRIHPSKRGSDMFDASGILLGQTAKGSRLILSYSDNAAADSFTILSANYRAVLDDMRGWFCESSPGSEWRWGQVRYEQDIKVSRMTTQFASDILTSGRCALPTLRECYPAHEFILSALQPHFKRFMGLSDRCPVT